MCFVTVVVLIVFQLHQVKPDSAAVLSEITVGEFFSSRGADRERITLPHDWHSEQLHLAQLWYRFSFSVTPSRTDLYAIYLQVISENAVAYLNGIEIGSGGTIEKPLAKNWPGPLIFPVASEYLARGENVLELHVLSVPPGRGFVPIIYFGKWTDLVPSYNYRKVLKETALGGFLVILVASAFFLFLVGWHRPNSIEYTWAGATFLGLTGRLIYVFYDQIHVPPFLWDWWQQICIGYTTLFMLLFVSRYFKLQMKAIE